MKTADRGNLELLDAWYENDPAMRVAVDFPLVAATGNQSSAVVCFEIEPDHYLGTHNDSAEEILLILSTLLSEQTRLWYIHRRSGRD